MRAPELLLFLSEAAALVMVLVVLLQRLYLLCEGGSSGELGQGREWGDVSCGDMW